MLLLAACGASRPIPPPDLPAVGSQVTLFRFPAPGGLVEAYNPDSLGTPIWSSLKPVPALSRVLGADPSERVAWALDEKGVLLGVDLDSRTIRTPLPGPIRAGAIGPDGSLYLADSTNHIVHLLRRTPVRFHDPLPGRPRALFGGLNDQLLAVAGSGDQHRLMTANAEQVLHSVTLPAGEVAATWWADLLAVAADTAIVLFETGGTRAIRSLSGVRHVRDVAFSPSGHRLYAIGDQPEITVFDRFALTETGRIPLPGPPRELRIDPSGRWVLVRALVGDTIWVADLATRKLAATVAGAWAGDLPLIAGASILVVRVGDQVSSWDLRRAPVQRVSALNGSGGDQWIAAAWVPRERVAVAAAAAESAIVAQDSLLLADSSRTGADSVAWYLQVSASQNGDRAADFARILKDLGLPASVLKPGGSEDAYRVVIGPYPTREDAEAAGQKLGRPYFVLKQPARLP